jgi:hypothetical protein
MAYITKSNASRIIKKVSLKDLPDLEGSIYKKEIYFFSRYEIKELLLVKSLMKDPEKFAIELYVPISNKDNLQYVFESELNPSYHAKHDCERLNSNFRNFEIPFEIKQRARDRASNEGKSNKDIDAFEKLQVVEFRNWFREHFNLFQNEPEEFLRRLDVRWNVQRNINEIERDNSGVEDIENLNLEELEKEIDRIISSAGQFFTNNPDKQEIIRRFQKMTFLAYKKDKILNNDSDLSDDELRTFLYNYDIKFKKPIIKLLKQYYRVKYNPDLTFDGMLLEKLNFRPCMNCHPQ